MSERYLVFIAGNALLVEVGDGGRVAIRNNRVGVEVPLSTPLLFDIGVYFVVFGSITSTALALEERERD